MVALNGEFEGGGRFRVEIPSVEGPVTLDVVLQEAERRHVVVHRISQGSGVAMLSDDEISQMVRMAEGADIELCLFLGPRGTWDIGAATWSTSGGSGARVRGALQLEYSMYDAIRAVELGVKCLLVADEGVLWSLHQGRRSGLLPDWVRLKFSALAGPANPASFCVVERLGADSINVPGDLPISDLAAIRAVSSAPIDIYIESPDALGGFVRQHEAPRFIDEVGRVYLKFGLRNAPEMYPAGLQTEQVTVAAARERVRRAALLLEQLDRLDYMQFMSPRPAILGNDLVRFDEPD